MKFSELEPGMSAESETLVTEERIQSYAEATNDFNSIHFNDEAAMEAGFKRRIAHGGLPFGFVSAIAGNDLPGKGTIAHSVGLEFLRPVYVGSVVKTRVEITELRTERRYNVAVLDCLCTVEQKVVSKGIAQVIIPLEKIDHSAEYARADAFRARKLREARGITD